MAARAQRLPANVEGELFVDSTCIDCDACRWIAPSTFDRSGELSRVYAQPRTPEERERAFLALVACPVGAIGADAGGGKSPKEKISRARDAFPVPLEDLNQWTPAFTANRPVNAVPYVCAARPGVLSTLDLPHITPWDVRT